MIAPMIPGKASAAFDFAVYRQSVKTYEVENFS